MIIGVTGYGGSGASACIALIKEFDNVQYYDGSTEFQILQEPDGIVDLHYNLVESRRRLSINTAIIRFKKMINNSLSDRLSSQTHNQFRKISLEYIDSLCNMSWLGKSTYDPQDLLPMLDKKIFKYPNALIRRVLWKVSPDKEWPPINERYYSNLSEDDFNNLTKSYLNKIFLASGFSLENPILLEQLFSLEDPTVGFDYFDDARAIIVDRDPRDFYTLVTKYWPKSATGYMPNDGDVKKFVDYYKGLHHSSVRNPKIKFIQFEDLIYRYEKTIADIECFLEIKHIKRGLFFKPELSINNTRVYELHPELKKDIEYIEENLGDYIYPFEKYIDLVDFERGLTGVFDDKPNDLDAVKRRNKVGNN